MPWLVALIGSIVFEIIKQLAKYFTKKVAIGLGFTAAFLGFFAMFVLFLESLFAGLTYVTPVGFSTACSWFIPSNFTMCLSAIVSAKIARFVWELTMHKMDLFFLGGFN